MRKLYGFLDSLVLFIGFLGCVLIGFGVTDLVAGKPSGLIETVLGVAVFLIVLRRFRRKEKEHYAKALSTFDAFVAERRALAQRVADDEEER